MLGRRVLAVLLSSPWWWIALACHLGTVTVLVFLVWDFSSWVGLVAAWYPEAEGKDHVALALFWASRIMAVSTIAGSLAAVVALWRSPSCHR